MDSEDLWILKTWITLLEQHREQSDCKHELFVVHEDLITLDLDDDNPLVTQHASRVRLQFNCFHNVKKLISTCNSSNEEGKGVKLPKIDVPTFNGDVLNWTRFWDQFKVSVHDRTNISNAEKLVYLQQAIKGGSSKNAIEGLSRSGDNYDEAIDCL